MNESKNSRIKKVRETFCGDSNVQFARDLGKQPNTTSNWVREGYSVGRGVASLISTKFGVNLDWLLTGEGEMLKATAPIPLRKNKVIRFWENIEATGGGIMTFDDTVDGNYSEMVLPDFTDCTDAIRLVGDSMYPRYKSGQIIEFKEWRESFV